MRSSLNILLATLREAATDSNGRTEESIDIATNYQEVLEKCANVTNKSCVRIRLAILAGSVALLAQRNGSDLISRDSR